MVPRETEQDHERGLVRPFEVSAAPDTDRFAQIEAELDVAIEPEQGLGHPVLPEEPVVCEPEGAARSGRDALLAAEERRELGHELGIPHPVGAVEVEVELDEVVRLRVVEADVERALPALPEGLVDRGEVEDVEKADRDLLVGSGDDREPARRIRRSQGAVMVEAVDRLDVELLVRGDRRDQAPLDLDPARVGRVDGEAPRGVELDLAGDAVAVRENDDVGLLGESGRGGRDERERDERGLSHGPQCNRTARFRLPLRSVARRQRPRDRRRFYLFAIAVSIVLTSGSAPGLWTPPRITISIGETSFP